MLDTIQNLPVNILHFDDVPEIIRPDGFVVMPVLNGAAVDVIGDEFHGSQFELHIGWNGVGHP